MEQHESLEDLIAAGKVIRTEFSNPKKRILQTSHLGSKRPVVEELRQQLKEKSPSRLGKVPEKGNSGSRYKSPITHWKDHAQHYYSVRAPAVSEHLHSPEINPSSKQFWPQWKPEVVESRLLRLESERVSRLQQQQDQKKAVDETHSYSPEINESSRIRTKNSANRLYEAGISNAKKRLEASAELVLDRSTPVPTVNPNIVEAVFGSRSKSPIRRTLGFFTLSNERLRDFLMRNYWKPMHSKRKSACTSMRDPEESECCFQPNINRSSISQCQRDDLYERLMEKHNIYNQKRTERCDSMLRKEESECTFQPKISHRSLSPAPGYYTSKRIPLLHSIPDNPKLPGKKRGKVSIESTGSTGTASSSRKESIIYIDPQDIKCELIANSYYKGGKLIEDLEEIESNLRSIGCKM